MSQPRQRVSPGISRLSMPTTSWGVVLDVRPQSGTARLPHPQPLPMQLRQFATSPGKCINLRVSIRPTPLLVAPWRENWKSFLVLRQVSEPAGADPQVPSWLAKVMRGPRWTLSRGSWPFPGDSPALLQVSSARDHTSHGAQHRARDTLKVLDGGSRPPPPGSCPDN